MVVIVTGAGRAGNIGVAVCNAFLREGAKAVIGTDRRIDEAEAIRAQVESVHGRGRFLLVEHDVVDEGDWRTIATLACERFGGIDVLVNNAGMSIHGGIEETSLSDLRATMGVNHDALFLGMKVCAPALAEAVRRFPGGGAVINNISMASYMSNANNIGYHVSKAAARMLTLCAAKEFGSKKIRVNSIHPGVTMTPLIQEGLNDYVAHGLWESAAAAEQALAAMAPLGMTSQPEDVAHAFVYLASDESRFVTGAAIYHDGGLGQIY
jgi:NAD(P)-dependent dehydrogenase (short-subunit alcohol dehydrogenase family)